MGLDVRAVMWASFCMILDLFFGFYLIIRRIFAIEIELNLKSSRFPSICFRKTDRIWYLKSSKFLRFLKTRKYVNNRKGMREK